MLYILNFLLWFFLPGLLCLYLVNVRRAVFLLAFALSYLLLLLPMLVLIPLRADVVWFSRTVYAQSALLLFLAAIKAVICRRKILHGLRRQLHRLRRGVPSIVAVFLVIGLFLVYWLYAGPYTAIPADIWSHLARFQAIDLAYNAGSFWTQAGFLELISGQDFHWYFITSWLCRRSGMDIVSAYPFVMLANSVTFLLGVFYFGLMALRRLRFSRSVKAGMALAAVFFVFAQLGVLVFSYVRYYALAPAMLNHVVFLAALAIWINVLEGGWREVWGIMLLPAFLLLMLTVHTQEASFTAIMLPAVSLASAVAAWYRTRNWNDTIFQKSIIAFFLSLAAWGALFLLLRQMKPASDKYLHNLLLIGHWLPFLGNAMIVRLPIALEVITCWGLFAYLLFIFKIRLFIRCPLLAGGMLIPFVTYFNPVFIDMVLRTAPQGGAAAYRYGYIVPVAFVGGVAVVIALRRLLQVGGKRSVVGVMSESERYPAIFYGFFSRLFNRDYFVRIKCIVSLIVLVGLIALLFPLGQGLRTQSRLLTLLRVPPERSHELYDDLCVFLSTLPSHYIIADAITEYVVAGLTHHQVYTRRFDSESRLLQIDSGNTTLAEAFVGIELCRDTLVIVNRRDGSLSRVGGYSLHWPADVLKVSRYYPDLMVDYIENRPEVFRKIWDRNKIAVYEVNLSKVSHYSKTHG